MGKAFNMVVDETGIGVVTIDAPGAAINTWSEEVFESFRRLLKELEIAKGIRGILFLSAKPGDFLAGADLKMIARIASEAEALKILDLFHGAFDRLLALGIPTVAAIHGHCFGGGLEFALACTGRIAQEGKNTLLGLPECKLGLLPGGGGTQRLPRLIGLPALPLVLMGTTLTAAEAHGLGIVDRLCPETTDLCGEARAFLEAIIQGQADLRHPVPDFSGIDAAAAAARAELLKANRGRELPGHILALRALCEGVKLPLAEGLALEKRLFAQAVMTKEAKGSIHSFFLQGLTDKPRAMQTPGFVPRPLERLAVLGFGTMGRGIVIECLRNTRLPVLVKDVPAALEPGRAFVSKILEGMAEKGRLRAPVAAILARLTTVSDYTPAFAEQDLVIEAVFEDLAVKKEVYGELSRVVRPDCLVASNTSSIPIAAMAPFLVRPERFGGTHFFSPVWMMQLVEVIRGEKTAPETVDQLLHFASLIRKRPIVCRDNAGFVVNAMLFPNLLHALQYVEEGNPIEAVDRAMTRFGMPVGPIRLTDEVGIDVPYKALVGMGIPQETLKNVVAAGRLGLKKSGKGFFQKDGTVDPEVLPLVAKREPRPRSEEEIQQGILTAMVETGKDLLDRQIVADCRMIDAGMIWGIGFPAEKGGPMKWADLTGLSERRFGKPFYES